MISLAIICNDKKEYLHLLQDSLAQADGVLSEVILVTSESQESVPFLWQGKQVNVYSSGGNLPAMYNLGMQKAQGEYVLFCKADATLDSEFFANLKKELPLHEECYIFTQESAGCVGENTLGWDYQTDSLYYIAGSFSESRKKRGYNKISISEGCWLVKRKVGFFDERFNLALFEHAAVLSNHCSLKKIPACKVYYRNIEYMDKIAFTGKDLELFEKNYPDETSTMRHEGILWVKELLQSTESRLKETEIERDNKIGHVEQLLSEKQQECEKNQELKEEAEKLQALIDACEQENNAKQEKLKAADALLQQQQKHMEALTALAEKTFREYAAQQQQAAAFMVQGTQYCEQMLNSSFFKLLHFWSRLKCQLLFGDFTEKIHFLRWLLHRPDEMADRRFQPLNSVYHTLQAALAVPSIQPFSLEERLAKEKQLEEAGVLKTIGFLESAFLEYIRNDRARFSAIADQFCETNVSREIVRRIRTVPAKGVLVSPCVEDRRAIDDAYFLLDKMAKAGWLCLLASNDVTCVQQVSERLLLVPQTELLRALQIEPVVLLLGWAGNVAFADAVPEKKIWYHLSDYSNRSTLYDTVYEQVHAALLERATFVTYGDKKLLSQLENRADATEVSASTSGDTLGKLLSSNGAVKLPAFYQKHDVIILSVIDYDFRFQRPQHFAVRFAENGHRVFYINANFHRPASVHKQSENLYVVDFFNSDAPAIYGTDWSEKTESIQAALL